MGQGLTEEGHAAHDDPGADDAAEHRDQRTADGGALEELEGERLQDRHAADANLVENDYQKQFGS